MDVEDLEPFDLAEKLENIAESSVITTEDREVLRQSAEKLREMERRLTDYPY